VIDSMPSSCGTPTDRARKAFSRCLQAMQEPGTQHTLAVTMGVSDSTVSRIKAEKLEDALTLICQLGFKVVSAEQVCVDRDYLQALQTLARMQAQAPAPTLEWD
jgi:DNA-binding XRE family transcriptional regulator